MISILYTLLISSNAKTYIFHNKGVLKINNYTFRESTNPIFHLHFNRDIETFYLTYNPSHVIETKSYLSKTPLQDINKKGIADSIEFYKKNNGFTTILASAITPYNFTYSLSDNTNILMNTHGNYFSYFRRIYQHKGHHRLQLHISGNNCLCTSHNKGYTNSYQLGVWDEIYTEYNKIIIENNSNFVYQENYIYDYAIHSISSVISAIL